MSSTPLVRVVVVNYDDGEMTMECLRSIEATDYPAERLDIVLVDNGSLDDVVTTVRRDHPAIRVIEPFANTGFAGGCNLGIAAPGPFDHVALVNNDATVDPGWLRPLVAALDADPIVAAACPKILFAGHFQEVDLEVAEAAPVGRDGRDLGVRISAVRVDGERQDERLEFDEGFYPPEPPHRPSGEEIAHWSSRRGALRLLVTGAPAGQVELRLSAPTRRPVVLRSGSRCVEVIVDSRPRPFVVDLDPEPIDVINNVGSNLYAGGFGGDRGFLERDHGQYEAEADVFAWCGGGVLLRGDYLRTVGTFDERFFLYYEDTDLSWRGQLAGWRYRYVPTSLVRHRHAQSSVAGSPTFRFYTERNRLMMLLKDAPWPVAARAWAVAMRDLARVAARDLLRPPLSARLPQRAEPGHRLRVVRSAVANAPAMLSARRAQHPVVARESILRWQTVK